MWGIRQARGAVQTSWRTATAASSAQHGTAETSTATGRLARSQARRHAPGGSALLVAATARAASASLPSSARLYHAGRGAIGTTPPLYAKGRGQKPGDDVEIVDEVAEDELGGDDLFGGSSVSAAEAHKTADKEASPGTQDRSQLPFHEQYAILENTLNELAEHKSQKAPSRRMLRNLGNRVESLEELRSLVKLARQWTQDVYYRPKSLAHLTEADAAELVIVAHKIDYPEVAYDAIANRLKTGFEYNTHVLRRLQTALVHKLVKYSSPRYHDQEEAAQKMLESEKLEGAVVPRNVWDGASAGRADTKDGSLPPSEAASDEVTPGDAEAVAEGEGAPLAGVPETANAADSQARVALERAKLSLVDRTLVVASMSAGCAADQKSIDEMTALAAVAGAAKAFNLVFKTDAEAIQESHEKLAKSPVVHAEVLPRIDTVIAQLQKQQQQQQQQQGGAAAAAAAAATATQPTKQHPETSGRLTQRHACDIALFATERLQQSGNTTKEAQRAHAALDVVRSAVARLCTPKQQTEFDAYVTSLPSASA